MRLPHIPKRLVNSCTVFKTSTIEILLDATNIFSNWKIFFEEHSFPLDLCGYLLSVLLSLYSSGRENSWVVSSIPAGFNIDFILPERAQFPCSSFLVSRLQRFTSANNYYFRWSLSFCIMFFRTHTKFRENFVTISQTATLCRSLVFIHVLPVLILRPFPYKSYDQIQRIKCNRFAYKRSFRSNLRNNPLDLED